MIEKATEAFWERLAALSFIGPDQIANWRSEAMKPEATWLQLCQSIQRDSPLTANHLQTLALGVSHPPIAIGGCLVLRPTFQALGWEAYEARHIKLQQNWRLVVLPTSTPGHQRSESRPELDSRAETDPVPSVDLRLIERVRALAATPFPDGPQVVDVQIADGRTIVTMPRSTGRRLSQYLAATVATPATEMALADRTVWLVQELAATGCEVSRLDPLLLTIQDSGKDLVADDLLSSEWLEDDFFPSDLSADEAAVVLDYRARRARFLGGRTTCVQNVWREGSAALDFFAARLDASSQPTADTQATAASIRNAASELRQISQSGPELLPSWLDAWYALIARSNESRTSATTGTAFDLQSPPDSLLASVPSGNPESLINPGSTSHPPSGSRKATVPVEGTTAAVDLAGNSQSVVQNGDRISFFANLETRETAEAESPATVGELPYAESGFFAGVDAPGGIETAADSNSAVPLISVERSPGKAELNGKSTNKATTGAIAARQASKREQQRRQQVVTALAVAAPFPIFLGIFLIAYFLWPSGGGLPDVSNQSGGGELPVAALPDSAVGIRDTNGNDGTAIGAPVETTKPEISRDRQVNRDNGRGEPANGGGRSDDDLLADLVPTTTGDSLLDGSDNPANETGAVQAPGTASLSDEDGSSISKNETIGANSLDATLPGDLPIQPPADGELGDAMLAAAGESVGVENVATAPVGVAETGGVPEPGGSTEPGSAMRIHDWVTGEPAEEDGYVSFAGVLTAVDWTGAWRATHGSEQNAAALVTRANPAGAATGADTSGALDAANSADRNRGRGADGGLLYVVSVGRVNSTTAKNMLVALTTAAAEEWTIRPLEVGLLEDTEVVQAWELGVKGRDGETPKPVARLQTTQTGHLELRFSADDAEILPADPSLQVELSDKNRRLTQMLDLSRGQRHPLRGIDASSLDLVAGAAETRPGGDSAPAEAKTESDGEIANLAVDPRSGAVKAWSGETTIGKRENLQWHFQVASRDFKALDPENPTWQALKFRGKEVPYISDELLDAGSLVLTVATETGDRWRVQARLHLLTPTGLRPFKKATLEEATTEATVLLQRLQLQQTALRGTRAKPGGGDLKQAELNRLDAAIKEVERYLGAVGSVAGEAEQLFEQGIAFGVAEQVDDTPVWLLKSAGFEQP